MSNNLFEIDGHLINPDCVEYVYITKNDVQYDVVFTLTSGVLAFYRSTNADAAAEIQRYEAHVANPGQGGGPP